MSIRAAREDAIDALCRGFADDALSMPELERRLEKAREARTGDELRRLLEDLPAPPPVPADATRVAVERPGDERSRPDETGTAARRPVRTSSSLAFAVMAGVTRAGLWKPPENMLAVAIMGGVELDFRQAVLTPGTITDISCFAFWGGVEITVPPDVHVDTGGFALLGGFDEKAEIEAAPPPDAPVIRVTGLAIMGGVEVRVKERRQAVAEYNRG